MVNLLYVAILFVDLTIGLVVSERNGRFYWFWVWYLIDTSLELLHLHLCTLANEVL